MVYTGTKVPKKLPREQKLTNNPIRCWTTPLERLKPESRICFGKTYCVEHNVKVFDLGAVMAESMADFIQYWRTAMGFNEPYNPAAPTSYEMSTPYEVPNADEAQTSYEVPTTYENQSPYEVPTTYEAQNPYEASTPYEAPEISYSQMPEDDNTTYESGGITIHTATPQPSYGRRHSNFGPAEDNAPESSLYTDQGGSIGGSTSGCEYDFSTAVLDIIFPHDNLLLTPL
jgi:hypothetical protein